MPTLPEPDDLYNSMDPYSNRDAQVYNDPEVRRAEHQIPSDVYDQTVEYLGKSPYDAFPMTGSRYESAQESAVMRNEAKTDYNPNTSGLRPPGFFGPEFVDPNGPLGQFRTPSLGKQFDSEIPTATSQPWRPRTVAAGYDGVRGILTLMFRDGTLYNYYEITPSMWATFKSLPTKWRYIADVLDAMPRGYANTASVDRRVLDLMYQTSRAAQILRRGASIYPSKTTAKKRRKTKP